MVQPNEQAAFVAALRKKAEEQAASNPVLAEIRLTAKTLVDEVRRRTVNRDARTTIGAYLAGESVHIIDPSSANSKEAAAEILAKLVALAKQGEIKAAAIGSLVDKELADGSIKKFVELHVEHSSGKALISAAPVDESLVMRSAPGAQGPSVAIFGGPTKPKIFAGKPDGTALKAR